jgi:hypothetical protein
MDANSPSKEDFELKIKKYYEIEKLRGEIYWRALNLIDKNLKLGQDQVESRLDAYLLLLASWNAANFRKFKNEDFNTFKNAIYSCEKEFSKFDDKNFESIEFGDYRSDISEIFNKLSSVRCIMYTGSSKVMHLRNPKVFLMWDTKIRGKEGYKIKGKDGNAYVDFLNTVQHYFSKISPDINKMLLEDKHRNKTVTKAIDEYNYVTITQSNK